MYMQIANAEPQTKLRKKKAGSWLKELRGQAGLSQMELASILGLKYYTFVSQVESGFVRVPVESIGAWAEALGANPSQFAKQLLSIYEPEWHRLLFEVRK